MSSLSLVAQTSSMPPVHEYQMLKDMAKVAMNSGNLPTHIKNIEQAFFIMLKGRELGIAPLQALSSIVSIQGKLTMSAELQLALILKNVPGSIVDIVETNNERAVYEAQRPGGKRTTFSFTMDDAKTAGLTGKDVWKKFPANMLRARCVSNVAKAMFADALSGVVYTPEELGAEVDGEGQVLALPKDDKSRDVTPPLEVVAPEATPTFDEAKEKAAEFPASWGKTLPDSEMKIPEPASNYLCKIGDKYKNVALNTRRASEWLNTVVWFYRSNEQKGTCPDNDLIELKEAVYLYALESGANLESIDLLVKTINKEQRNSNRKK